MRFLDLLLTTTVVVSPLAARAAEVEVTHSHTPPSITAELSSQVVTNYVFRGRPQYEHGGHPTLINAGKLRIEGVGPGALIGGVEAVVAVMHHDELDGQQLALSPSLAYTIALGEETTLTAGYTFALFPYAEQLDDTHELSLSLEQGVAGFVLVLESALEVVHRVGDYTRLGISRPFLLGELELSPGISGAVTMAADRPLAVGDLSAVLGARYPVGEQVVLQASASYAWVDRDDEVSPSTVWGTLGVAFRL